MTTDVRTPNRKPWIVGAAIFGVAVIAVLAFGVFGVQTLFFDDEVDEAGPTFKSGATTQPTDAVDEADPGEGASDGTVSTTAPAAEVREAGRGTFEAGEHPGEGTAVVLTDGQQTFVRFEEDFSTDNGPDLYAVAYVGDERIELAELKGNKGAQNYEVPASVSADDITSVAVWCKRFDATFTTAAIG